jgi:hypothetical protein
MLSVVRGGRYDALMKPARARFADHWTLAEILSPQIDRERLELFLIHFCALGVHMTAQAERWMHLAGDRCRAQGLVDVGRLLETQAHRRAQRNRLVTQDAVELVRRWNARRAPRLDPQRVLTQGPTPSVLRYRKLHEVIIAGAAPFASLAVTCEIERLVARYGPDLIRNAMGRLGPEVLDALASIQAHVWLDDDRDASNVELDRLVEKSDDHAVAIVRAGGAALEVFAAFLVECLSLAVVRGEQMQARA